MRSMLLLLLAGCIHTAPPKPIDPGAASKASAALRIGAHLAGSLDDLTKAVSAFGGDVSALETPEACAVSLVVEGVLNAGADGIAKAATAPVLPGGSVDLTACGVTVDADPAIAAVVSQVVTMVTLSLDLGGVAVKDPCGYTYAVAVLALVDDVVGDVLAGGAVAWDEQPLTGVECGS